MMDRPHLALLLGVILVHACDGELSDQGPTGSTGEYAADVQALSPSFGPEATTLCDLVRFSAVVAISELGPPQPLSGTPHLVYPLVAPEVFKGSKFLAAPNFVISFGEENLPEYHEPTFALGSPYLLLLGGQDTVHQAFTLNDTFVAFAPDGSVEPSGLAWLPQSKLDVVNQIQSIVADPDQVCGPLKPGAIDTPNHE